MLIAAFLVGSSIVQSQPFRDSVGTIRPTAETSVHDPVMIRQNGVYYIFCTGFGISVFSSSDMLNWKKEKAVFDKAPHWAVNAIPGFKGHIWAPDISFKEGLYYLYYAVSSFGSNNSCIGLATNKSLNPADKDFKWIDKGKVLESRSGRDLWNAIDPDLVEDESGNSWLAFGSFWNGIKLVKLDKSLSVVAEPQEWYTIASRPRDFTIADSLAGNGAIEAPFIFRKSGYYYLFVSWDYCCRAEKSDYKLVVGRSKHIQGPYLDKSGKTMSQNGGSLLLEGDKSWYGVGHNAVYTFDNQDYMIFHGYEVKSHGMPKLRIEKLDWDAYGWPLIHP